MATSSKNEEDDIPSEEEFFIDLIHEINNKLGNSLFVSSELDTRYEYIGNKSLYEILIKLINKNKINVKGLTEESFKNLLREIKNEN